MIRGKLAKPTHFFRLKNRTDVSPQHKTAFTLIELLVVVGIISILAGLLLPALSTAKGRATSLVCMNRQRQLWFASMAYATDHKDWAEPASFNNSSYYYWTYFSFLSVGKYVDFPYSLTLRAAPNLWEVGYNLREFHAVWGCPARPYSRRHWSDEYTIGINRHHNEADGRQGCRMKNIKRPSHLFFMGDGSQSRAYMLEHDRRIMCHVQGSNYVYIDGHAKWWPEGIQEQYFSTWSNPAGTMILPWHNVTKHVGGSGGP